MQTWLVVMLCVASCARSPGAVSRPDQCVEVPIAASARSATVNKLALASNDVLIQRDAGLVAGYLDVKVENLAPQRRFVALNFNDTVVFQRQALLSDTAQLAALEKEVNEFLSHAGWEVMQNGRRSDELKGRRGWRILDWVMLEDDYGALTRVEPEGDKGLSPYGELPGRAHCPEIKVEVSSIAMDRTTRRVFVTYRRTQGPDCGRVDYAHTFLLWTGWDFGKPASTR